MKRFLCWLYKWLEEPSEPDFGFDVEAYYRAYRRSNIRLFVVMLVVIASLVSAIVGIVWLLGVR